MSLPTDIHMHWGSTASAVSLNVSLPCRPITGQELHMLADLVTSIEEMRDVIANPLPELDER